MWSIGMLSGQFRAGQLHWSPNPRLASIALVCFTRRRKWGDQGVVFRSPARITGPSNSATRRDTADSCSLRRVERVRPTGGNGWVPTTVSVRPAKRVRAITVGNPTSERNSNRPSSNGHRLSSPIPKLSDRGWMSR